MANEGSGARFVPLGLFLFLCQRGNMTQIMPKNDYLCRLLELSDAMLAAFKSDDVDMASALYEERERFMNSVTPSDEPARDGLLDRVLERDQDVITAANVHRQKMLGSASRLNAVRGYSSGLPRKLDGGDWGSG